MNNIYTLFFRLLDQDIVEPSFDKKLFIRLSKEIVDQEYFSFIKMRNGGYFCNYGIQFYSISDQIDYQSIFYLNDLLRNEFGSIISDMFFIGQDIFGNQFGMKKKGYYLFNIETGDIEFLAKCFDDLLEVIYYNLSYYSGKELIAEWVMRNNKFIASDRFAPKIPFVLGGDYTIDNIYSLNCILNIRNNANIAKQVHNLPDGTNFKIEIT
jgi:hypothetical protein